MNSVYTTDLFLYQMKTSENNRFSDVYRGYKKRPVVSNGLHSVKVSV